MTEPGTRSPDSNRSEASGGWKPEQNRRGVTLARVTEKIGRNKSGRICDELLEPPIHTMKIRKTVETKGESRELLLKEYFLNAYLIALLKQVGAGMRARNEREAERRSDELSVKN